MKDFIKVSLSVVGVIALLLGGIWSYHYSYSKGYSKGCNDMGKDYLRDVQIAREDGEYWGKALSDMEYRFREDSMRYVIEIKEAQYDRFTNDLTPSNIVIVNATKMKR